MVRAHVATTLSLYLDLVSGISGDMFLGALVDLGVDPNQLGQALLALGVSGWQLRSERRTTWQIQGTKLDVVLAPDLSDSAAPSASPHGHEHGHSHEHGHKHGRRFADIQELIRSSDLSEWVKARALAVFARLARAEGAVHGIAPADVQFHEVGAVDSIIDIVGSCVALELLGKPRLLASAVTDGTGWVDCAHGRFPVPVPATLAILAERGVSISQCSEPRELVTPTGAALIAELVESFGPLSSFVPRKVGYGLGSRENETRPNVLRALLGEAELAGAAHDWEGDSIAVLETNLDDVSAEVLGHFVGLALARGALDVFHTPIQMKKSRPGVLLTVLCAVERADELTELLLRETSAFGVRRTVAERRKLRRELRRVKTDFGEVVVKLGMLDGEVLQRAPEYESCREIAAQSGQPLRAVFAAALSAASAEKSEAQ
jgi:pyridinium-3,5-bisthiocarboxylic acid mononucleotide nickel chelatase